MLSVMLVVSGISTAFCGLLADHSDALLDNADGLGIEPGPEGLRIRLIPNFADEPFGGVLTLAQTSLDKGGLSVQCDCCCTSLLCALETTPKSASSLAVGPAGAGLGRQRFDRLGRVVRLWEALMVRSSFDPGIPAEVLGSLGSPATLETPFGAMEFFDGVPRPTTVALSYDALDLLRGIDVFLNCMPGASMLAMRNGLR